MQIFYIKIRSRAVGTRSSPAGTHRGAGGAPGALAP